MTACVRCDLCNKPGGLDESTDTNRVPCNVRRFKDDLFTMWRCNGCGSIHCKEDADLAAYYAHYPLKEHRLDFHTRLGYRRRLALLRQQGVGPEHRILDFGCGTGVFVEFLRSKGFGMAFGYDAFVPAYHRPERLSERYDVIVSYDVIEHDEDPRRFLRSLTNMLEPGGLLVIGTPNADHLSLKRIADPGLHPPYHRHIFSERALTRLGEESGLNVQRIYRRSYYDTLVPTVNSRFMWRYIEKTGGFLDASVEPPQIGTVLKSPELLFTAFLGYFFPLRDNMIVSFRKSSETHNKYSS